MYSVTFMLKVLVLVKFLHKMKFCEYECITQGGHKEVQMLPSYANPAEVEVTR